MIPNVGRVTAAATAEPEGSANPLLLAQGGPTGDATGPFASAAAAAALEGGLWPIPVAGHGDGKSPLVRGFTKWERHPGPAAIRKWAQRWLTANVAILTGHRVTVVDIDDPAVVDAMIERFGNTPLRVGTPSGGIHLYYRADGEHCTTLRPMLSVDIKGRGGYVVVPPSVRPEGQHAAGRYEFLMGSWAEVAQLPKLRRGSLSQAVAEQNPGTAVGLRTIKEGRRNIILFRQLLPHARQCRTLPALVAIAQTINAACDPPLPTAEVEKTASSAWKYEIEGRNWSGRCANIRITADELNCLAGHSHGADLALFLLKLRGAHSLRRSFAASPKAMARTSVIPGWSLDRYRRALKGLLDLELLFLTRKGGTKRGDTYLYSLSQGVGGARAGVSIILGLNS